MEIGKFSLGEFTIDRNIKKSGCETILFKTWHPRLGHVAIKEWTNDAYDVNNEIMSTAGRYIQLIIESSGILMNNKSNYIGYIMPYMPMENLHDAEKYDEKQISSWVTQTCYGLSHLYFKKIIHTDIKPNNVLLGKSHDDIKLSDFGMARSLESISHTLTQLGTPVYMVPEIFKKGKYDSSADIFSLLITLLEILHRRLSYNYVKHSSVFDKYEQLDDIWKGGRPQLNKNLSKEASGLLISNRRRSVKKYKPYPAIKEQEGFQNKDHIPNLFGRKNYLEYCYLQTAETQNGTRHTVVWEGLPATGMMAKFRKRETKEYWIRKFTKELFTSPVSILEIPNNEGILLTFGHLIDERTGEIVGLFQEIPAKKLSEGLPESDLSTRYRWCLELSKSIQFLFNHSILTASLTPENLYLSHNPQMNTLKLQVMPYMGNPFERTPENSFFLDPTGKTIQDYTRNSLIYSLGKIFYWIMSNSIPQNEEMQMELLPEEMARLVQSCVKSFGRPTVNDIVNHL